MKRVAITGATGAIGFALIDKLIESKCQVLAICRENSSAMNRIKASDNLEILECDMSGYNSLQTIDQKYDVFYHLAWDGTMGASRNDAQLQSRNIQYTLDAVELAHRLGCGTFIGAGSQAEYGRVEGLIDMSTPANPETGYGIAKLCAGQLSRISCHQLGMKHVWPRIFSVYGPNDDENTMVMSLIRQLQKGESPACTMGEQIWDYLYSDDAADALYQLAEKGKDGKMYNLASGDPRPLRDYIDIIQEVVNSRTAVDFGGIPYAEKQVMCLSADISDLESDIGFQSKVDFAAGIQKILDSQKKNGGR